MPLSELGTTSFIATSLKEAITANEIGGLKGQRNCCNNWCNGPLVTKTA